MVHRYCERFRIFRTLRRCRLGSYLFSRRKSFTHSSSRTAYALYEWAGIPGTLLCGWMSDKLFKGRRAPAGILFMVGVFIAVLVYWLNPPGNPMVDSIALVAIGFLIYGPVMLIGLHALDLAPKKALELRRLNWILRLLRRSRFR